MRVSSKTSMSSASFHNFDSRSNGLRCDCPTYKLNLEPLGKRSAPRILRVFIRPPFGTFGNPLCTFWQSFASRVLKNRGLSYYGEIFLSISGGFLGASLGFGRLGQNPAGAINWSDRSFTFEFVFPKDFV